MIASSHHYQSAKYSIGKVLGYGAFGKVCFATRLSDNKAFAAKCFKTADNFKDELRATKCLEGNKFRNVVEIVEIIYIKHRPFEIMELLSGGEVFRRVEKTGSFSERAAASCLRDIACALSDLANANIVHRDVKTENFVYVDDSPNSLVKLIDFGLAVHVSDARVSSRVGSAPVGTHMYLSPETVRECWYSSKSDVWAAGVSLFVLLVADNPFSDDKPVRTKQILAADIGTLTGGLWDGVSDDAKDLVRWMLQRDPEKRPTPEQILTHRWIALHTSAATGPTSSSQETLTPREITRDCRSPEFQDEYLIRVRRQLARDRLRKALLCVRWTLGVRFSARKTRLAATAAASATISSISDNVTALLDSFESAASEMHTGCLLPACPSVSPATSSGTKRAFTDMEGSDYGSDEEGDESLEEIELVVSKSNNNSNNNSNSNIISENADDDVDQPAKRRAPPRSTETGDAVAHPGTSQVGYCRIV